VPFMSSGALREYIFSTMRLAWDFMSPRSSMATLEIYDFSKTGRTRAKGLPA
jgi:hypothetical protein